MPEKFSIKKAGGIQLGPGLTGCPVFSGDGRIFAVNTINSKQITVWDLATRAKLASCRFAGLSSPYGLTLNHDGSRAAMRSDGKLEVLDTRTGERLRFIKKNNLAEGHYLRLNARGDLLFDASAGLAAGFFVWNVDTGKCLEHYPLDGIDYMLTAIDIARDDTVAFCLMVKAVGAEKGMTDFLYLWSQGRLEKVELSLNDSTLAIAPDGQRLFVAGRRRRGEAVFRLIDRQGKVLIEREMGSQRTFPVLPAPHWSPDGRQIAWKSDSLNDGVQLLNAATLDVTQTFFWPSIAVAFGRDDWIAIAGHKGIVLPQDKAAQAVAEIGKPAAEEAERRQHAYSRAIALRKACPPRAAVFQQGNRLRIEAEQLVGHFRYLPIENACREIESAGSGEIGQAVRQALVQFRLARPDARERCLWSPSQETALLQSFGIAIKLCEQVRYLGRGDMPFANPAVGADARCLIVTQHENLLELWPTATTADGRFREYDWPHIPLSDAVSDEELGAAVLAALQQSTREK